ncbi:UNVERIFIED_CONTAM: hypothetical protein FKN15_054159 [Acipenser sinensis]
MQSCTLQCSSQGTFYTVPFSPCSRARCSAAARAHSTQCRSLHAVVHAAVQQPGHILHSAVLSMQSCTLQCSSQGTFYTVPFSPCSRAHCSAAARAHSTQCRSLHAVVHVAVQQPGHILHSAVLSMQSCTLQCSSQGTFYTVPFSPCSRARCSAAARAHSTQCRSLHAVVHAAVQQPGHILHSAVLSMQSCTLQCSSQGTFYTVPFSPCSRARCSAAARAHSTQCRSLHAVVHVAVQQPGHILHSAVLSMQSCTLQCSSQGTFYTVPFSPCSRARCSAAARAHSTQCRSLHAVVHAAVQQPGHILHSAVLSMQSCTLQCSSQGTFYTVPFSPCSRARCSAAARAHSTQCRSLHAVVHAAVQQPGHILHSAIERLLLYFVRIEFSGAVDMESPLLSQCQPLN